MNLRLRNLALAAIAPLAVGILVWSFLGGGSLPSDADIAPETQQHQPLTPPTATASPVPSPALLTTHDGHDPKGQRRQYAVGLHELSGLPADVSPGTAVEVWVAWDPPVTDEPRVQRLIRDARVSDMIPPVIPEGPVAVVLSVPLDRLSDLIYGDRYGSLSAVLLAR